MVELVEVAQVAAAVQGPAAGPEAARLTFNDLCVAEERIQDLPDENDGTQEQIGNADPQDPRAQPISQVQPVSSALVFGLQTPFVFEERAGTPEEDQLKVVLEAACVEDAISQQGETETDGQQRLVHHRHHVVLKAQDAVVDVQLGQFLFVDADLMLFLDLDDPRLHLLPGEIRKVRLSIKKQFAQHTHHDRTLFYMNKFLLWWLSSLLCLPSLWIHVYLVVT